LIDGQQFAQFLSSDDGHIAEAAPSVNSRKRRRAMVASDEDGIVYGYDGHGSVGAGSREVAGRAQEGL
jgi:hypothetical protein